ALLPGRHGHASRFDLLKSLRYSPVPGDTPFAAARAEMPWRRSFGSLSALCCALHLGAAAESKHDCTPNPRPPRLHHFARFAHLAASPGLPVSKSDPGAPQIRHNPPNLCHPTPPAWPMTQYGPAPRTRRGDRPSVGDLMSLFHQLPASRRARPRVV